MRKLGYAVLFWASWVRNFIKDFASGVYIGRCPDYLDNWTIIIFPYKPDLLCCGFVGVIEFKKKAQPRTAGEFVGQMKEVVKELKNPEGSESEELVRYSPQWVARRRDLIQKLAEVTRQSKLKPVFYNLFIHSLIRKDLAKITRELKPIIERGEKDREIEGVKITSSLLEGLNKELITLRDITWSIQHECLLNIRKVKGLVSKTKGISNQSQLIHAQFVQEFRKINFILNNLDRLEVRGRDSAGLSIMVIFPSPISLKVFLDKLKGNELDEELKERQGISDFMNRHIFCHNQTMTFTFKVSAEVGRLGDNVVALRKSISHDPILHLALQEMDIFTNIISHTRWASVGIISEENCHPVNNECYLARAEQKSRDYPSAMPISNSISSKRLSTLCQCISPYYQAPIGSLQVVLNGDIDNYAELKSKWEQFYGASVSERITTDTKIIPLQVEHYLREGNDLVESFRRAVNDFEGSQAIAMQSDLEPDKIFLALRGSGQAVFVGIGEEAYFPASEIYGFVEETSRFIKMDGERVCVSGDSKTIGQIMILDANSLGGLTGLKAMSYDGQPLPLLARDIKSTEITTRDIDRRGFLHYFLKEIFESPQSIKKTILAKVDVVYENGSSDSKRLVFNMGEEIIPTKIIKALQRQDIKNIYMVGQGTAGVAAGGIAMLFREYLAHSGIKIAEQKASELSGFCLNSQMNDTLVIAVTQSGTTTDTNKAVDMAKNAGAHTLAIVNRRNSDITYKVDGVLYTGDGRDIEMSVASTKAFYSQIVAGCLLGLRFAQCMGFRSDEYLVQEIKQLKRLPRLMVQILENNQEEIKASAKRWAFSKRNWAVVGSGPNKVAADEIRIKLSELCYKTLPADVVEDRKHIDLSAEPLIVVCAAGSRQIVLGDIIKDVAIFKAHKATTIVIADEGENRFKPYADSLIQIPKISEQLAPILNTVVGHLWGYYAALYTDEETNFLRGSRQLINQKVAELEDKGYKPLEIVFDRTFQDLVNEFAFALHQKNNQGIFNASIKPNTISNLILLLKYTGGKLPIADLERDFQIDRGVSSCLDFLQKALDQAINELSRPIDAIKHQAKTVTVGTSRLPEMLSGYIFDYIRQIGVAIESINTQNLSALKRLQPVVKTIKGYTLYEISELDHLGRPTEKSTIRIVARGGISQEIVSRVEKDPRLKGRKRSIITGNTVFIGVGKADNAKLLIVPAQGNNFHQKRLILFHIEFEENIPLQTKIMALGAKHEDLVDALAELDIIWQDEFLRPFSTAGLFIQSEEVLVENIRSHLPNNLKNLNPE